MSQAMQLLSRKAKQTEDKETKAKRDQVIKDMMANADKIKIYAEVSCCAYAGVPAGPVIKKTAAIVKNLIDAPSGVTERAKYSLLAQQDVTPEIIDL